MKSATISLLAVVVFATLFLESSTHVDVADKVIGVGGVAGKDVATKNIVALVPTERIIATINNITREFKGALDAALNKIVCHLRRELLLKALTEQIKNIFSVNNAALDEIIKAVTDALAKAKGAEKDCLTQVMNWLKPLVELSTSVENTICDAVLKDSARDLQNAINVLQQAIEEVDANLAKSVKTLEESPSKLENSVKAVIKNNMDSILHYANENLKSLKSLLPGVMQGCNAAA